MLRWPRLLPRLLRHIGSDSILHLLEATCVGDHPADEYDGSPFAPAAASVAAWLPLDHLVPALMDNLSAADEEVAVNSAELLANIIQSAPELPACLSGKQSAVVCGSLVARVLGGEGAVVQPVDMGALNVLLKLLSRCRTRALAEGSSPGRGGEFPKDEAVSALADTLYESIENLFVALAAPPAHPARISRFLPGGGAEFPPSSARPRCALLALIEEALRMMHRGMAVALIDLGLFSLLLDMLLLPHSCNVLHMRVVSIIDFALTTSCDHGPELRRALVSASHLASRLVGIIGPVVAAGSAEASSASPPTTAAAPACFGFAVSIADRLVTLSASDAELTRSLQACEAWAEFAAPSGPLACWRAVQAKALGGRAPTQASEESDDEEDDESFSSQFGGLMMPQVLSSAPSHPHPPPPIKSPLEGFPNHCISHSPRPDSP